MSAPTPADLMEVGDELEPLEFVVTPELNQQYLYAVEDLHPRYAEEGESGPPLVHPALLLNMSNTPRSPSFSLSPGLGAIHAGEETRFLTPARVGQKLRVTWKVVDRFEKRGRVYHARDVEVLDEDGTPILRRKIIATYASQNAPRKAETRS